MAKKFNYFDDEPLEPPKPSISQRVKENMAEVKPEASSKDNKLDKVVKAGRLVVSAVGTYVMMAKGKIDQKLEQKAETKSGKSSKNGKLKASVIGLVSLILVVAIMITTIIVSSNAVNSRQAKFNESAYKVCVDYMSQYGNPNYASMKTKYNISDYMLTGVCHVRETDFDDDGLSELLIVYNSNDKYYADVWAFDSDDFKKIHTSQLVTPKDYNDGVWLSLYTKGREVMIGEHRADDITKVDIFEMHTTKFKEKNTITYNPESFTFSIRKNDVTDNFERIKVVLLSESKAANMSDEVLKTVDSFGDSNAKKTSGKNVNDINTAYYALIDEYNRKYGPAEVVREDAHYHINGLAMVDMIDFNNDDVKELVLVYYRATNERTEDTNGNYISVLKYKYFCDIYTFRDSNVHLVYQSEGLSNKKNDNDERYFLTKRVGNKTQLYVNTFTSQNYNRVVKASSKALEFNGEQFVQKSKNSYVTEYGYTDYYMDGKYVYSNNFKERGGFDAPFFDGGEEYDSSVWNVAYVMTKSAKKEYLSNQVSKTVSVIKSINPDYDSTAVEKVEE